MILGNLGHNDPNSDSGDSNGVELFRFGPSFWLRKIVTKSPLSRHGLPQATFRGYPPKIHRKSTEKIAKLSESWAESGDLLLLPKAKKKWRAFRPVFPTLGGAFQQAEYRPHRPPYFLFVATKLHTCQARQQRSAHRNSMV